MTDQEPDAAGDGPAGTSGAVADLGPRFLARLIDGVQDSIVLGPIEVGAPQRDGDNLGARGLDGIA